MQTFALICFKVFFANTIDKFLSNLLQIRNNHRLGSLTSGADLVSWVVQGSNEQSFVI